MSTATPQRSTGTPQRGTGTPQRGTGTPQRSTGTLRMMLEHEAVALLSDYGIPYPEHGLARSASEAVEVAERLKLPPADFFYLGDSAVDMKTATAAGMFPVGVLWGFRPAEELKEAGAQALIERPSEILNLL